MANESNKNKNLEYLSVLFTDIVGYSKLINADQISCKAKFNEIWLESLSELESPKVVSIDTGDGAILTSLGDPEIPVKFAILLLQKFSERDVATKYRMSVRMGIHFGPVEVANDINGNPTVLGDGINSGQRIMSFANPNELLISRPYLDLIAPLSYAYKDMFGYFGKRPDKHNRFHELYCYLSADLIKRGMVPYGQETSSLLSSKKSSSLIPGLKFIARWLKEILKVIIFLLLAYEIYLLFPIIKKPELMKYKVMTQYTEGKNYVLGLFINESDTTKNDKTKKYNKNKQ